MSVLETLEICFTASLNGADAQLEALSKHLDAIQTSSAGAEIGLRSAGQGLTDGLAQVIRNSESLFRKRGAAAAQAYAQGLRASENQAISAGRALSEGFARGISQRSDRVDAAIRKMTDAATKKLKKLLSIQSPSKVTEAYGAFFAEGFANGILGAQGDAARAAGALGDAAVRSLRVSELPQSQSAAQADVFKALERVNLTIPIQVDGMKLGEASIRGINAVTRSAGKLMLNL